MNIAGRQAVGHYEGFRSRAFRSSRCCSPSMRTPLSQEGFSFFNGDHALNRLTSRMIELRESVMNRFPEASIATPCGEESSAFVAERSAPLKPDVPFPATVEMRFLRFTAVKTESAGALRLERCGFLGRFGFWRATTAKAAVPGSYVASSTRPLGTRLVGRRAGIRTTRE